MLIVLSASSHMPPPPKKYVLSMKAEVSLLFTDVSLVPRAEPGPLRLSVSIYSMKGLPHCKALALNYGLRASEVQLKHLSLSSFGLTSLPLRE